jgi:hypothetical protein
MSEATVNRRRDQAELAEAPGNNGDASGKGCACGLEERAMMV